MVREVGEQCAGGGGGRGGRRREDRGEWGEGRKERHGRVADKGRQAHDAALGENGERGEWV